MSLFKKLIEGFFVLLLISCSAEEKEIFSISTELHDVMSEVRNENVPVSVILPPNFVKGAKEIPLLINLHGGGGDRNNLLQQSHVYQEMFNQEVMPPMVIVSF